jgi:hypothetical protein
MTTTTKKKLVGETGKIVLDLSKTKLKKRKFKTFSDLRKDSYGILRDYREKFVKTVLEYHGITLDDNMSRREKQELLQKNLIGIIKDDKSNRDKIYKEGNLIAYWNNQPELEFKKGKLLCTCSFKIYKIGN